MKKTALAFSVLILSTLLISWVAGKKASKDHDLSIELRMMGHRLALRANDHTGKILPIEKINENEYIIRFENEWTLNTDTLTTIAKQVIPGISEVKVFDCDNNQEVFAFFSKDQESIIPCLGRQYNQDCYYVKVKWVPSTSTTTFAFGLVSIGLLVAIVFGFLMFYNSRKVIESDSIQPLNSSISRLNEYTFHHSSNKLYYKNQEIALSNKEAELTAIFFKSPNTLVEREYLMKTIWEDQGVFVGRSLDVFISKLRKKLNDDPAIHLVSVFGKGYKLEITNI